MDNFEIRHHSVHVSGYTHLDVETSPGSVEKLLVKPTPEVQQLIKKKVLLPNDMARVRQLANRRAANEDRCCVPGCPAESRCTDCGRPLCWSCWDKEAQRIERLAKRHYRPPPSKEVDLDNESTFDLLFEQ